MSTAVLQRKVLHEVTEMFDVNDENVLRSFLESIRRAKARLLAKKEPELDAQTKADIELAHKEYAEGKYITLSSAREIEGFFEKIKKEANDV